MSRDALVAFRHYLATGVAVPGSALLALVAGSVVYVTDRDWASTTFLAPFAGLQPAASGFFGPLGFVLPSFLHAYAFALLLILALGPTRRAAVLGAGAWFVCAATLEILQAGPMQELLVPGELTNASFSPSSAFQTYIVNGRFDPGDVLASLLGCVTALAISLVREAPP